MNARPASDRALNWLVQHALPLWVDTGFDAKAGCFHERLIAGRPDHETVRRVRVQARQVYVYSMAYRRGWTKRLDEAGRAVEFLLDKCWQADGAPGFVHRLNPDTSIADACRDTYDHAFHLMAFGAWFAATGETRAKEMVDRILDFLDSHLADTRHGGFRESLPDALPRRQNPHMHMFEAMLVLYDCTGEARFLERASEIFDLFTGHFFDREAGVLREWFTDDWSVVKGRDGRLIEGGHLMEWVWLLNQFGELAGRDTDTWCRVLYDNGLDQTLNPQTGFVYDENLDDGKVTKPTHRAWGQTELIRAHAVRPGRLLAAEAAMNRFLDIYCHAPVEGAWIDQLDASGEVIDAAAPGSTLYHIFGAVDAVDAAVRSLRHAS